MHTHPVRGSFIPLMMMMISTIPALGTDCDFNRTVCLAQANGDVLIGILLPSHNSVKGLSHRTRPEDFPCSGFDLVSFVRSLSIIHTIEEINADPTVLPGVRLGYVFCDTCSDAGKALQNVNYFLAFNGSLPLGCNYTDFRPSVKVILGARFSEVSIAVARQLGIYMVPQVSCTSSSPALSDKLSYPAFLRTIPSDVHQTKAVAKVMDYFNWTWVGVVYGDDSYGRGAFQSFLRDAEEMRVCVAYQEVLPHYLDHEDTPQRIKEVAERIRSSSAKVVLLILKVQLVKPLFEEMIRTSTSRTWIASDAWSRDQYLARLDGINTVGDILGFTFVSQRSKSLDNYLKNLQPPPEGHNYFIKEYKNLRFNCTPECFSEHPPSYCPSPEDLKIKSANACSVKDPQKENDDYLVEAMDTSQCYSERIAVWAVVSALQKLLRCNSSSCSDEINFPPWQLLQELRKVKFELNKETFSFDKDGNFVNGYDLIMWEENVNHRKFQRIGKYSVLKEDIQIEMKEFNWLSTGNHMSRCSLPCEPGFVKKISNVSCCYNCTPCVEGTYSDAVDSHDCKRCPNGTWSLKGSFKCEPRLESYMKWNSPHPITLVAATAFGVLLLGVMLIIFLVHRDSAPMKRAEVRLSCVMMAGLAVSFGSVICFIGRPNIHLCRARQVMYAMGFTLCVSCILVKAFRTFLAFLPFGQVTHRTLNKLYNPPVIVSIVTALQAVICILWLVFDSPDIDTTPPSPQSMDKPIQCNVGTTYIGFGIMLSYIALLAFVGFLLAFKGRKVPQEFSETGYIIFSMIMYLFVWVCFVPVYITNIEKGSPVQASAILVSSYGIIFCHFLPKCYEAIWGTKTDTLEKVLRRWRNISSPIPEPEPDNHINKSIRSLSQISMADSEAPIIPESEEMKNKFPLFLLSTGTDLRKKLRSRSL
ncbi:G-protein coupled receptor family C group 6 member A [Thalassophryne amazonica]|uniref:G-protein coupled receptor family C group 6 member A n=1 Tax=Thalassophryne amazonica TaxID=390379 RepID=UPI0014717ACD|nr:G-protein coupled receptor family C group 6 member A [Thalassophryne amazonica]